MFYGWARPVGLLDVWPYRCCSSAAARRQRGALRAASPPRILAIWFWITLSPASSFVAMAGEVGAERRMYLPLIGLLALVVVGIVWLVDRRSADRTAVRGVSADQSSVRPTYGLASSSQSMPAGARNVRQKPRVCVRHDDGGDSHGQVADADCPQHDRHGARRRVQAG